MIRVFVLASALLAFTACSGSDDPTGPQILNSGDNNCFNVNRGSNNPCSTPSPVVVTPVFAPEPEPEG